MTDFPISQIYTHNFLHLVGVSILYYDFFITLGTEIEHIWLRPKTMGSWLFLLNRYFSVLADIAINVGNFVPFKSVKSCHEYALFRELVIVVAQVLVGVLLFLRTYALFGRDKRVAAFILAISAVLVAVSIWAVTINDSGSSVASINMGCHIADSVTAAIHTAVAWEALFAYDSIIFCLTLFKTYKERRHLSRLGLWNNLVGLMLRDGAIYFAVMASVNLSNTLTFYLLPPVLKGVLSTFASSISVTMMSRLILNLHEEADIMKGRLTPSGVTSTSENSTSLLFTSRLAMSSRNDAPISVREQEYSAELGQRWPLAASNSHGIEEVIELQDMSSPEREMHGKMDIV